MSDEYICDNCETSFAYSEAPLDFEGSVTCPHCGSDDVGLLSDEEE